MSNDQQLNTSYENKDVLKEPYAYLLQVPGKRIRSRLINAFNVWLCVDEAETGAVKEVVQMLHTASLLLDDIEDDSDMRRGIPVAHHIYGIPSTINCANYVMFLAMKQCQELGNLQCTSAFLEEMIRLHEGQGFDILWRDTDQCPTMDHYTKMVLDKTGGLFRLAFKMLQSFSTNTIDYIPLVNDLGLFFQIQDDYMNLQSEEYAKNKDFAEDLSEGKFSYPIIYAIRQDPNDHRLRNILKQRTKDLAVKKYAVKYMQECGAFEFTKKELKKIRARIDLKLAALGGNEGITAILDYLSNKIWTTEEGQESDASDGSESGHVALKISADFVQ